MPPFFPHRSVRLSLNNVKVKAFTDISISTQPQAPITGTTLAERLGLVKVLVDRPSAVMARVTRVILDGPKPVPQDLYEARRWVCALCVYAYED